MTGINPIIVPTVAVRGAIVEVSTVQPSVVILPQPALATNLVDVAALRPNLETINITTNLQQPDWVAATVNPQPIQFSGLDIASLLANQNKNISPIDLQTPAWIPATSIPQPILDVGIDINSLRPNLETINPNIGFLTPPWIAATAVPQPVIDVGVDINSLRPNIETIVNLTVPLTPPWIAATAIPQPVLFAGSDISALRPNLEAINFNTAFLTPPWIASTLTPQIPLFAGSDISALRPNLETVNLNTAFLTPPWIAATLTPQVPLFAGLDITALLANQNKNISPIDLQPPVWIPATPNPQPPFNPVIIPSLYPTPTVTYFEKSVLAKILQFIKTFGGNIFNINVSETLSVPETILRRVTLSITETLHVPETVLRKVALFITETLHVPETILRRPQPKVTSETQSHPETILRRCAPIVTETLSLVESLIRKITRVIPMQLLYDNFESGTYTYTAEPQASPNNLWTCQFRGLGTAGVHTPASGTDTTLVDFQTPAVATSSGVTHSSLVTSNSTYRDIIIELDMRTISQLRTGSPPNNWEVAWLNWHWSDASHLYYFTPKMSGTELGKVDGNGQIILATTSGTDFTLTLGQWYHVRIVSIGNRFQCFINGTLHIDYTDVGVGGFPSANNFPPSNQVYSGSVALYCEDSQVEFDNVNITPTESIFLKEGILRNAIPKMITETLTFAESILRRVSLFISETLHFPESVIVTKGKIFNIFITETTHFAETNIYILAKIGQATASVFRRIIGDVSGLFRPSS